jgi:hypothetical protein
MPSFDISAYYRQSSMIFCNFRRFSLRVRALSLALLGLLCVCVGGVRSKLGITGIFGPRVLYPFDQFRVLVIGGRRLDQR